MWLDLTKSSFDAQSYVLRYGNFELWLYFNLLVHYAEQMKFKQVLAYSFAIIVWVYNFQIPKILAWATFCEGNDIAHGSNRSGG